MKVLPELGLTEDKPKVKLDTKDKKILLNLSKNFRIPLTKLTKKVGLSRDSIKYRIKNLEKKGVIKGSRAVINTKYLGYDSYHIFLTLRNPEKEKEKDILKEISSMPNVRAVLKLYGRYDIEIAMIAKSNSEFDIIFTNMLSRIGTYLKDYEIMIVTETFIGKPFPKTFIEDKEDFERRGSKKKYIPDKKDFEIMKLIRNDAGKSLLDISKKVFLSPDAVSYRLRNLEKETIISYVPVINYNALGYDVYILSANLGLLSNKNNFDLLLKRNKSIIWGAKTLGRSNILAYVCVEKTSELQETINEMRRIFHHEIISYENFLAFAEYKYTYAPDCLFHRNL